MGVAVQPLAIRSRERTAPPLAAILDHHPEGIALLERGRVRYANPAFVASFGLAGEDEILGRRLADLRSRCHPPAAASAAATREAQSWMRSVEFDAIHPEGFRSRQYALRSQFAFGGRHYLMLHLRAMAVDAASQDERRYRAMYRAAAIGIVRCTSEGCILDSNAAIEKMLNCSHEELQGRFLQDLFASEAGSPKAQSITKLLRPGKDALQADLKYSGGKTSFRWVRLTASAIHVTGEEEPSFVVMAEDITQYKNAERQLRDAQKMEAIGRLVGGVAHDFNNLLTGIMLYCDLLCSGLAAGSRPRQHAEEIRMAGEQGAALVQQLLALARQQVVEPRTLCLNQKITETRDLLSRLIGENIELHTDLDPALGNTCIDPVQVQQVLLNLVLNARDAMPSGGRVRVKTSNCTFRMTGDALPARELSGVALSVADNGCGMSEETKAHLFEPFFTTKASGRGNGLGLTTVHEIVQNAGGVIEVETAPGAGTTFRVILPRIVESEKATFPAVHYSPQACAARILVLEDNLTVRQAVCRILSECGYQVIEAASGAEALQLARANHSQIDLVLADLSLPGMNGRTVARRLRSIIPNLKCLFMSGYDAETQAGSAEGDRVVLFRKPFTGSVLLQMVREVLDTPPPPPETRKRETP